MGPDQYRSLGAPCSVGSGGNHGPIVDRAHSKCSCGSSCNCKSRGDECSCGRNESGPQPISRTTGSAGVDGPTAVTGPGGSSCKCSSDCDCTSKGSSCTCGSHAAQSSNSCKCRSQDNECTSRQKEPASAVCYEKEDSSTNKARGNSSSNTAGGDGDGEMHHSQYFKKMDDMSAPTTRSGTNTMHSKL